MIGLRTFSELPCRRALCGLALVLCLFVLAALPMPAQTAWQAVGPDGGDARAFATVPGEPSHLYLGTTNSWIYESFDEGGSWRRLAQLDPQEDLVVDNIVVDASNPRRIWAGGWKPDQRDGALWVSQDSGKKWTPVDALKGQSVFALAQAPSDAKVLYAGTLEGVYRSSDAGATWQLASPPGSKEVHEVESLAVDPRDSAIVYAGTWHLPWKTTDGGKSWKNIKEGVIDDSDVFSIIIDPVRPRTVFLSACSGIYKSENAGQLFHKIQGIPSTARRTRVLMQDPTHRDVVYAGTTEGLYKTVDGGRTFSRLTGPDVIVNDVYVDPTDSNRVLLATDRGGVLVSDNAGATFAPSNAGFSGRKVQALLVDRADPSRLYAGVVNDKEYGGVFASTDGGAAWTQLGQGLDGRDVFSLGQTADGALVAGTGRGVFVLQPATADGPATWQPRNTIANTIAKAVTETHAGKHINVEKQVKAPLIQLESRVSALDVSGESWVAATAYGLLTSRDKGATWQGGPIMGGGEYLSVAAHGATVAAARAGSVVLSTDGGRTWMPMGIPAMLTRIHRVVFSADGSIWLAAREGIYFTQDKGKTWRWLERLPFRDVDDLVFDPHSGRILICSQASDQIYSIDPKNLSWKWWQTGYRVGLVRIAGDRLIAASLFDGVLVQPQAAGIKDEGTGISAQR